MKLHPIGDKVIISPVEVEKVTEGGIIVPDNVAQREAQQIQRGVVVAIGEGVILSGGDFKPTTVKPGDQVLYAKYGGTRVEVEGEQLIVMMERDIHCIVEGSGQLIIDVPVAVE